MKLVHVFTCLNLPEKVTQFMLRTRGGEGKRGERGGSGGLEGLYRGIEVPVG